MTDVHNPREADDHGLAYDLETIARQTVGRRRALALFGAASGAALVAGCGGGGGGGSTGSSGATATTGATTTTGTTTTGTTTAGTTTTTLSGTCVADPTETNGPFPADGTNSSSGSTSNVLTSSGVVRTDIRSSFISSTTTVPGVNVMMTLTLVKSSACATPLTGYVVYIWHCDATGNYSLYNTPAESYLRGVQVTDGNGQVTFTTIFPGCYSGRYPHIHFEIFSSLAAASNGRSTVLTSQLLPAADACTTVYNGSANYTQSITNFARISIATDGVFGDNTAAQIAQMTMAMTGSVAAGYTATNTIAINV